MIDKLKSNKDEFGYNIANGGNCVGTVSEQTKRKLSKIKKGKYVGELNPNYGNGDKIRGSKNPASRKVICVTTGKVFDTTKQGASYYGLTRKNVSDCCTGMQESTNRYGEGEPLKWMYYEDYMEFGVFNIYDKIKTNRVICLDTGQVYDNPYKAHKSTGYKAGSIKRECLQMLYKGKNNPIKNIETDEETIWMYYEDYLKYKELN